MPFYPVNLKVHDRFCLIIGGGEVAARKIESLLVCGARIRVISPMACDFIRDLAQGGKIEWWQRGFQAGDLHGAFLVFAATNDHGVQKQVIDEAGSHDILLNSVDVPESCSFQVPATVRQGDLLITVSTGGGSPALSAWIRKKLAGQYDIEYGLLVDLFKTIRSIVIGDGGSVWSHKQVFEKILEVDVLTCLRERDWPTLQTKLIPILPKTIDVAALVADISTKEIPQRESRCKRGLQDG